MISASKSYTRESDTQSMLRRPIDCGTAMDGVRT